MRLVTVALWFGLSLTSTAAYSQSNNEQVATFAAWLLLVRRESL